VSGIFFFLNQRMGNKFIEKLFYFLERPLPSTREHEWEHHMVSGAPCLRGGCRRESTRSSAGAARTCF